MKLSGELLDGERIILLFAELIILIDLNSV